MGSDATSLDLTVQSAHLAREFPLCAAKAPSLDTARSRTVVP